jgi:hypothetical protein
MSNNKLQFDNESAQIALSTLRDYLCDKIMPTYTEIMRKLLPPAERTNEVLEQAVEDLREVGKGLKNVYNSSPGKTLTKKYSEMLNMTDEDTKTLFHDFVEDRIEIEEVIIFHLKNLAHPLLTGNDLSEFISTFTDECGEIYEGLEA